MSDRPRLSAADVSRLLTDPSPATRVNVAAKVAEAFDPATLGPDERALAEAIFRQMLRDAEIRVRQALAQHLRHNPEVPHDVALALARDVAEVAEPMLEHSSVLSDADLIAIVQSQTEAHQAAVARRRSLSGEVVQAIVDAAGEAAVAELMTNRRVDVPEAALQRALDRFPDSEPVTASMVHRPALPISVAERLVAAVSDHLRTQLVLKHELPPDLAADLVLQSRERATVGLAALARRYDLPAMVEELHRQGRLTPSLVLRALCTGDIDFFETALAQRAGIPVANAHILIHDRGQRGLASLYERCEMPRRLFPVVRAAVDVAKEMQFDGRPGDRARFVSRTIERVVTQFEQGFDADSLDYLIGKLGRDAA